MIHFNESENTHHTDLERRINESTHSTCQATGDRCVRGLYVRTGRRFTFGKRRRRRSLLRKFCLLSGAAAVRLSDWQLQRLFYQERRAWLRNLFRRRDHSVGVRDSPLRPALSAPVQPQTTGRLIFNWSPSGAKGRLAFPEFVNLIILEGTNAHSQRGV